MDFSVLESTHTVLKAREQIVGSTAADPVGVAAGATTRITGRPAALLHWCKATENAVIQRDLTDARVYAGFERFSRARLVADRYDRMRAVCESLVIVGQPDCPLDFAASREVPISSGPLLREWFLLVVSSSYCGLLSARDLDGLDSGTSPRERRFEGVITHHAASVRAIADEIENAIEAAL